MTTTVAEFDLARNQIEGLRQASNTRAIRKFTGADLQAAFASADRQFYGRIVAAAAGNSAVDASRYFTSLQGWPAPNDHVTATDQTPFRLVGGRYRVTVSATWSQGNSVTLVDDDANVFASFTANGSADIDLPFGTYNL